MSTLPAYTFLSWYRQGMTTYIEQPDDPSTAGSAPVLTFGIDVQQEGGNSETIHQTMPLVGPQNVVGIRPEAILKTTPLEGSIHHRANYLASIEFYEEDFPWRYTPAAPHQNQLRPWIWLLVLKQDECRIVHHSNRPLPYLTLPMTLADGSTNPGLDIPPDGAWAWAHVQVNQQLDTSTVDLKTALKEALVANPDVAFARLISPRRLEPDTAYHAFLVPFFEQGRLAGLGKDPSTANILQAAWTTTDLGTAEKEFPFYHQWSFNTSAEGDFETLARKLQPQALGNLPLLQVNAESPLAYFQTAVAHNDGSRVIELESALMAVGEQAQPWPAVGSLADAAVQSAVEDQLNPVVDVTQTSTSHVPTADLTGDIVVGVPPVYGKWHLGRSDWQALGGQLDKNNPNWIHQINTNLQSRALAGLGVQVVRENQETFVSDAWAQIGEVIAANRQINQTLLARESNYQLHRRLKSTSADQQVAMTGNLHQRIVYEDGSGTPQTSVKQQIKGSNLSLAPTNSAFTKLRRPSLAPLKKLKKQAQQYVNTIDPNAQLLSHINMLAYENLNGAPPKPSPYVVENTSSSNHTPGVPSNADINGVILHLGSFNVPAPVPADLTTQQMAIEQATNPLFTLEKRLFTQFSMDGLATSDVQAEGPSAQTLRPVMAAPNIQRPLYAYLKDIAQRFILPNLSEYGDNFVGLLNTNQAFIEQILVGANHEMSRELLWRGYPTDQRGTYFRQFWNVKDHFQPGQGQIPYKDIAPLHTWDKNSPLGSHRPSTNPTVPAVLVLKGELIRANPDLVIYAQKAMEHPQLATNPAVRPRKVLHPTIQKRPIFRVDLAPDIVALGFDLDLATAKGDATDPGWYFILKERPGTVKLGLDEGGTPPLTLGSWNDLHWGHMPPTSSGAPYLNPDELLDFGSGVTIPLADSAAQLAKHLYQAPLMLGIHAERLLP